MEFFTYKAYQRFICQGTAMLILLFMFTFQVNGQVLLEETFDSIVIPTGWSFDQQEVNWSVSNTQMAGGNAPEIKFSGTPAFFNYTRLISPEVNLSGQTLARLEFTYAVEHLNAGYTIGVAARNNNGQWITLWSKVPVSTITSTTKSLVINYAGFNTSDFQFAFFFQGNSQNISAMYIDNVKLFIPPLHDVAVKGMVNPDIFLPNTNFIPQLLVKNEGQSAESFIPVYCRIYDGNNNLVYHNQLVINQLPVNTLDTITFPGYTLSFANDFYRVETNVSLSTDLNNGNDSLVKNIKTLTLIDRRYVLTEMATATWCTSCPATSQAVSDLVAAGKQVSIAEYHSPSGDPFTNAFAAERMDYYNVQGYPTAIFDGLLTYSGSPNAYGEYLSLYNQRISIPTPFDIKIYGSHSGVQYNLNVILYRMAPVLQQNLVLRVILTESNISYNWLGQSQVNHVERLMIPDANGVPIDLVNHVQLNIPLSFNVDPAWNQQNFEVIAFLQDTVTKEVYQVNKRNNYELVPIGFQKIQGYVRYRNSANSPLQGVTVKLRLGGGIVTTTTTGANGYYSITGIAPGNYYLSCSYNGLWGGSNASDALLIMKYFTESESLDALQIKAADNDVTNFVNSVDALNVMRRFVGVLQNFNQTDWVFESPQINLPNSTIVNQNIRGLCTGDVNGSWLP